MGFTNNIKIPADGNRNTTLGAGLKEFARNFVYREALTDGVAIDEAEEMVSVDSTIDTAAAETWDLLSGGAGDHDCPGLTGDVTFTSIQAIIIKNSSVVVGEILTLGDLSANAFDACFGGLDLGQVEIPPGGCAALINPAAAGWTVDATHKFLQLAAAAGSAVAYEMLIIGRVN